MDKTEYRMKLDEINSLVEAQDYEGALQVADSIEWRRVKSIRTLCMVADIYEVNGRLEDSMKMLQLAYKRSSVGKMILYRLVELCLKMGRYDDAVSYYNEYLETASNDTSKYILKYKILKAQKAPLDDQIEVLEEYKEREYTERWVYELARLYKKAGKERKCVETCDDLILWFGEGKYVTKAMELKMTYTPLSASQREKYRSASGTSGRAVFPEAGVGQTKADQAGAGKETGGISGGGIFREGQTAGGIKPAMAMEAAAAASDSSTLENSDLGRREKASEERDVRKTGAGRDVFPGEAAPAAAEQPAVDAGKIRENSVQLQERLARSFQEVLSGINRTKTVNAFEALGKAAGTEPLKMPEEEENISEYQVKDLEPENTEEEIISAEKGEAIAHRTEKPLQPPREEKPRPEDQEITSVNDVDLDALFAETSSMIAEAIGGAVRKEDASESVEVKKEGTAAQDIGFTEDTKPADPEGAESVSGAGDREAQEEEPETEDREVQEDMPETEGGEVQEDMPEIEAAEEQVNVSEASEEIPADGPEKEKETQEADFSDIEEALAQAARSYMEENSGEYTETEDQASEEKAVAQEKTEEQPEAVRESREDAAEETSDGDRLDDQERAMAAFAASLGELEIGEEPEMDGNPEQEERSGSEEETAEADPEAELPEDTIPDEDDQEPVTESSDQEDISEAAMEAFEASLDFDGVEFSAEDIQEPSLERQLGLQTEEEAPEQDAEVSAQLDGMTETEDQEEQPAGALHGDTVDIEAELRAVLGEDPVPEDTRSGEDLAEQLFGAEEVRDEDHRTEEADALDIAAELGLDISSQEEEDRGLEEEAQALAEEEPYTEAFDMDARDMEAQLEKALGENPEQTDEPMAAEETSGEALEAYIEEAEEEISADADTDEPKGQEDGDMDFTPDLDMDLVLAAQKEKEQEEEALNIDQMLEEAEAEPEIPQTVPENETPEEKRIRIMNATRPDRLTDQQKKLFSYFAKVPGMDQQILDAINGAHSHAGEKTSHRGNIAIMGSHGTGKTRLSDGLVKALCKDLGLPAAKYARLDASDMNSKDPVRVIGKMAGGFLLIERAGHMSAETIAKLSKAMDFRTDSLILIIEDDKTSMRKLLADYPEFAEKFTTVISIPVFTNDELVTFARTYARENGYRMDEMGVLALYTLIGDNQREDEPITIGKVKEMVDGAIRKAGGGLKLGRKISKRHTDAEGRIYLYEKDFDL